MARKRKLTPTYSLHKASGRGRLTWTDPLGIRHERLLPGVRIGTGATLPPKPADEDEGGKAKK